MSVLRAPLLATTLFFVGIWLAAGGYAFTPFLLALLALLSLISIALYGWDKRAARRGTSRTPEKTLHLYAMLGGWPGAWLAQQAFRHKTVKPSFRRWFVVCVLLNLAVLAFLLFCPWNEPGRLWLDQKALQWWPVVLHAAGALA
ncbi:DUF1294 domain-containing protein [Alcanivorax hongdengensis]|nr:DUF1294 domain-containing protein [Alcanivorax hongdengensis]